VKVFDLFPFYNELDLLELRVKELNSVVDIFGLVELPVTFTDKPKPLYFAQEGPHRSDIHFHTPSSYPSGPHPTVDWFQRAQLGVHLSGAWDGDIVMVSDVDEIPNRDVVTRLIKAGIDEPLCLQSRLYYHRADLYDPSGPWSGTIICTVKQFHESGGAQELRHRRCLLPQIPDAGWHFSWLGNEKNIADKLLAVDIERDSNDKMKNPGQDMTFLRSCYETGADLFGRKDHDKVRVPIIPGVFQPHEIVEWLEKYPQYAAVDTVPY
jgi:beta-1,4-mannosyl-glycoprotein beta-1,4-N-acetylglucosaminyltransferase